MEWIAGRFGGKIKYGCMNLEDNDGKQKNPGDANARLNLCTSCTCHRLAVVGL